MLPFHLFEEGPACEISTRIFKYFNPVFQVNTRLALKTLSPNEKDNVKSVDNIANAVVNLKSSSNF